MSSHFFNYYHAHAMLINSLEPCTRKISTPLASEPSTPCVKLIIVINDDEKLHIEVEDQDMYLTLRSPGCMPHPVKSVSQAVEFTMPDLTLLDQIQVTKKILSLIEARLTKTK